MTSPVDIVNRSLVEIAGQATVSGTLPTFDGSPAGIAAGTVYASAVAELLRNQDWEFARLDTILNLYPNSAPYGWACAYEYPADCLRVRQIKPLTWDMNDPQPVRWSVSEADVAGVGITKCILTNTVDAVMTYTTSDVTEDQWDSMFTETMVRYLGSILAMGIGGRPDFSQKMMQSAGGLMDAGRDRDS
jgi:hypothetical protein